MKEWIVRDTLNNKYVQELVRCKDCKHYHPGFNCDLLQKPALSNDNWFCADGEKKDE